MPDTAAQIPRTAIYVHVPFCVHKCGYCDFNSWAEEGEGPQRAWLEAIKRQTNAWSEKLKNHQIDTIFFGGGTPSLLKDSILGEVLANIRGSFNLSPNYEWTLECNPETLTPEKFAVMAEGGVNRLSLGIQSFDDESLRRLERRARRVDNLRALEMLKKHWQGRWSADLMFGLPNQNLEKSKEDILIALEFGMEHLSAYQLTLATQRSKAWQQPPEESLLAMFDQAEDLLSEHGLARYEVSNFAKADQECRHNLRYWRLQSFVGIGPGAAGLIPPGWGAFDVNSIEGDLAEGAFGFHQRQPENFDKWTAITSREGLPAGLGRLTSRSVLEHFEELLMMGLRLSEGIWEGRFRNFPLNPADLFSDSIAKGLIAKNQEYWSVTPRGLRILDTLLLDLFAELKKSELRNLDLSQIDPTFK